MFIAYVLRLAPASLAVGELVGFVEEVDTGHRSAFHGLAELAEVIQGSQGVTAPAPRTSTD